MGFLIERFQEMCEMFGDTGETQGNLIDDPIDPSVKFPWTLGYRLV